MGNKHAHSPHKRCPKSRPRTGLIITLWGLIGLVWLLLRSGSKPTRLSYPCQQSAMGLAATAFGGPVVLAALAGRERLLAFFRRTMGKVAIGGLASLLLVIAVIGSADPTPAVMLLEPPADYHPELFLVNNARGPTPVRFGGIDDLATLMRNAGRPWLHSATPGPTSGPNGLIDSDDVVLIKVNAQWAQRGGTNSDVLRGIMRVIVEHPEGFVGEIIVADNGQGSGNLDRTENNAEDHGQSPQDVVNEFVSEGWKASIKLWDNFRTASVAEFSQGNMNDGYVVSGTPDPQTLIRVSYPKFRSVWGTYVSYKNGIWDTTSSSYNKDRLVVINVPVLKTHSIYGVTAAVKNHMGVITQSLSTDSHAGVGRGGLGSVLAEVRVPDLTILDCIWVLARPGFGPSASYAQSSRRDQLLAGFDPVALDAWAVKNILVPQINANGFTPGTYPAQDPDNPAGTFRNYLDRSMNEMLVAQVPCTNDYNAVRLWVFGEPPPIPALSTVGMALLSILLLSCGAVIVRRRVEVKRVHAGPAEV